MKTFNILCENDDSSKFVTKISTMGTHTIDPQETSTFLHFCESPHLVPTNLGS